MTPRVGDRLGSYEIVAPLGAGGMGEVYQARDSRLGRDVALKILPELFARDDDRLARFEREARALASLNHPNIAQIYGVEESGGRKALVMELVPGQTLEEILAARVPVPAPDAVAMARQIAAALEAAHECGIIHRDLKPANVKVRGDGVVKVLDFGLARAFDPQSASASAGAALPTITSPAVTARGVILGTAAYMSPEQARGQPVDKRADIWAFGVVLFEMLSGRRLFDGDTVSDALASVLRQEVPWDALPASTPMALRRLLRRCLQRDPMKRLRDIGDARLDDEALDEEDPAARGGRETAARRSPWYALAWIGGVVLAASTAAAALWIARTPPDPPARRFTIATEDGAPPTEAAISPDGRFVAYVTAERVWLQPLTEARAREVPGGDQARSVFWSPDSAWLGFQVRGQLWKIAVTAGSAPIAIARLPADFTFVGGAAWLRDGRILFSTGSSGLYEVPAEGGTPKIVVALEPGKDNDFHEVRALPDGHTVLFVVHPIGAGVYTVDAFDGKSRKRVFSPAAYVRSPQYSATGHLLFVQEDDLWAVLFDAATLEARGNPFLVEAGVGSPSVVADGTLVLVPGAGGGPQELVWLDRTGRLGEALSSVNAPIAGMRLSPDGRRAAAAVNSAGNTDVWLFDTTRIAEQRLTREAEADNSPAWLSDGRIAYSCARKVCTRAADGSTEPRVIAEGPVFGVASTPDGTNVVLWQQGVTTLSDIFVMAAQPGTTPGPGTASKPVIATDRQQRRSDVSPDGKYIAYESNETGRFEIYVSRFPSGEGKWDVSRGLGLWPRWSVKGDRIFFVDDRARIVEVDVQAASSFSVGTRRVVVSTEEHGVDPARDGFDRSADGQRFLVSRSRTQDRRRSSVFIIENWFALFRGRG